MTIAKLTEVTKPSIEYIVDAYPMGPRVLHVPRRQRVVYIEINEISYARLNHFSITDSSGAVDSFDYWEVKTKSGDKFDILKDELSDEIFP